MDSFKGIRFFELNHSFWFSLNDVCTFCRHIKAIPSEMSAAEFQMRKMQALIDYHMKNKVGINHPFWDTVLSIKPDDGFCHWTKIRIFGGISVSNPPAKNSISMLGQLVDAAETNCRDRIKVEFPKIWDIMREVKLVQTSIE
jgi:hypothetical protein